MGESCRRWLGGTQSQIISQSQIICAGEGKSRRMTRSKSFIEFFWKFCALFLLFLDDHENLGLSGVLKKRLCFCTRQRHVSLSNGKHA